MTIEEPYKVKKPTTQEQETAKRAVEALVAAGWTKAGATKEVCRQLDEAHARDLVDLAKNALAKAEAEVRKEERQRRGVIEATMDDTARPGDRGRSHVRYRHPGKDGHVAVLDGLDCASVMSIIVTLAEQYPGAIVDVRARDSSTYEILREKLGDRIRT